MRLFPDRRISESSRKRGFSQIRQRTVTKTIALASYGPPVPGVPIPLATHEDRCPDQGDFGGATPPRRSQKRGALRSTHEKDFLHDVGTRADANDRFCLCG